ncbi:hypothetical protein GIX45_08270 [Erwinia sp. CPCC 100877]|nr:hypothetical protein [Erwinia sp. CPCC 100877]
MNVTSDIEIKKDVVIDWGGYEHNFNTSHIYVNEIPQNIEFKNFEATASHPGGITAGVDKNAIIRCYMTDILQQRYYFTGEFKFTGTLDLFNASKLGLIYAPRAVVTMDGVKGSIDLQPVTTGINADPGKAYFCRSYRLNVINGSTLYAPYLAKFYGYLNSSDEIFSGTTTPGIYIQGGSKVQIEYPRTEDVEDEGEAIDILPDNVVVEVSGPGSEFSVNTSISIINDNNRGIIQMRGVNSQINIFNGGKINITSTVTAGIRLGGNSSKITIQSGGSLNVDLAEDRDIEGNNGIRFFGSDSILSIDGAGSSLSVSKNSGSASAIRFENSNQTFNVTNGGSLSVFNTGNGEVLRNGTTMSNSAIQFFGATGKADFLTEGEGSNIKLVSNSGAALDALGMDLTFTAGPKTYLEVEGKTVSTGQINGVIAGTNLTVDIDEPTYFDFQNTQNEAAFGVPIFQIQKDISFSLQNSEISLWRKEHSKDNNIIQSPYFYSLKSNLKMLNTEILASDDEALSAEISTYKPDGYTGILGYNRISANNQLPIIENLRVPTDADNKIYGHVMVPEGLEDAKRDAWQDEVEVTVEVTHADTSKGSEQFTAVTQGSAFNGVGGSLNPWGEGEQAGLFEVVLPNNALLEAGDKVKVISAKKVGLPDLVQELGSEQTTVDVTPPAQPSVENKTIRMNAKTISGTGEAGTTAILLKEGAILSQTDVDAEGKFVLSIPENTLTVGDELHLVLNDKAGEASAKGVVNKPATNNDLGNQNPISEALTYHDAIFAQGLVLRVDGILAFKAPTSIEFEKVKVTGITQESFGKIGAEEQLVVYDERQNKTAWTLFVALSKPFTDVSDTSVQLKDVLFFSGNSDTYTLLNNQASAIIEGTTANETVSDYTSYLKEGAAFKLVLDKKNQIVGDFAAEITWTLGDVPTE